MIDTNQRKGNEMTATTTLPATPAGWILGTDCGYRNHSGFVKDASSPSRHWSLTPTNNGQWCLAMIDNGIASTSRVGEFDDLVEHVG